MKELNEAPVSVPMEREVSAESFPDVFSSETRSAENRTGNEARESTLVDDIQRELPSDQLEKLMDRELQQPEVQRKLIDEFSPYSKAINPYIRTMDELSVYTSNGLQESVSTVLDRPCLQVKLDPDRVDAMGKTNSERMQAGRAGIDENGDVIDLHHIGQKENSPLAELPDHIHHKFDAKLHDKTAPTEVHGDGNTWNSQRPEYWKERAATL